MFKNDNSSGGQIYSILDQLDKLAGLNLDSLTLRDCRPEYRRLLAGCRELTRIKTKPIVTKTNDLNYIDLISFNQLGEFVSLSIDGFLVLKGWNIKIVDIFRDLEVLEFNRPYTHYNLAEILTVECVITETEMMNYFKLLAGYLSYSCQPRKQSIVIPIGFSTFVQELEDRNARFPKVAKLGIEQREYGDEYERLEQLSADVLNFVSKFPQLISLSLALSFSGDSIIVSVQNETIVSKFTSIEPGCKRGVYGFFDSADYYD